MSNMKNSAPSNAGNNRRAKPSFRNTRLGVLPSSIEAMSQLTVDAATKVALTAASVKLTVEIDAAGTRVFLADQRTGQMIGGPEDLTKLGGIRAFVTRERREASGIEIARVITEIAYRASLKLSSLDPDYEQRGLESSFGATVRPLLLTLERLEANKVKLMENSNPKLRDEFEPWLKDMFGRVRNAYYRHIVLLTKGESKKGQLALELFKAGVSEYVHTKITSQAFVLERSQELVKVLFPQDPSKGLAYTVREWTAPAFVKTQGDWMLRNSGAVRALITNERLVRAITKIDASVDLGDETNPSVAKLLKSRVHVVPPMRELAYVTEPGSKLRGGWKFPSPSMDSPGGALTALGLAVLRVYSANLQSVDLVGDFYHTIVPGAVSRQALSPTNNFYVQWAKSDLPTQAWFESFSGRSNDVNLRKGLWRWIRMELRLSEKGEAGQALALALGLTTELEPVLVKRQVTRAQEPGTDGKELPPIVETVEELPMIPNPVWSWAPRGEVAPADDLQRPIGPVEVPLVDEFHKRIFPSKKKGKNRVAQGANLTKLGKEAKFLIEQVGELSPTLASRITVWLRGFSDERLQAAASKLALAQFDELFVADNVDDDEESVSDDDSMNGAEV
nr:hypothetical protein [Oidiodendron maius splipalmivirus 1]